jgi:hypothetical protein
MAGNGTLSQKQSRALSALMSAPSVAEAAVTCGLGERTLWRWLGEPEFKAAYMKARREAMSHTITQLQQATGEAVEALRAIMQNDTEPASARVSAAKTVLEMALKELELEDLESRIKALEGRAAQNTNGRHYR